METPSVSGETQEAGAGLLEKICTSNKEAISVARMLRVRDNLGRFVINGQKTTQKED